MHILATTSTSLDDLIAPTDLRQTPADMVALSFSDSDLAGIANAWHAARGAAGDDIPDLRLAPLRDLRHPMSVDLWIEGLARHARVILVRILGGYDWWRYGCDRLADLARKRGIALILLPGECQMEDARLAALSTVDADARAAMLDCFREGGPDNLRRLVRHMARAGGRDLAVEPAEPLARAGCYLPGRGVVALEAVEATGPVVPLLFYRSLLLASDVAPIDALHDALAARGIQALPLFVGTLRDAAAQTLLTDVVARFAPPALITTTAFASGAEPGQPTLFDRLGVPVFQAVVATTRRSAWQDGPRGLAPADLAMHVVLPELDGRILAGALSFKDSTEDDALGFAAQVNRAEPGRVEAVAERIARFLHLKATPVAERRVAVLIPDYPNAPGRTGYAVGLDVPASVLALLADLAAAGYRVADVPDTARALMQALEPATASLSLAAYQDAFAAMPEAARAAVLAAWGPPDAEAEEDAFRFRACSFGNVVVALAPDRGRDGDRRADYHDPALPPRHALIAFGIWLRAQMGCHAVVHMGAHGVLEWLPGKSVALDESSFPEIVTGHLPVIYPFIVSNPGEAAQAKRRIAAVTLGHLTPRLVGAGLSDDQRALEQLVDEYAQADGLDRRRRDRLAKLIVDTAGTTGLATEAGVDASADPETALARIDAWLCDLKDFAIKDGLHIYGRSGPDEDAARAPCADAERSALLAALDGTHIGAGPAGAPARGRTDVLPTGRNLFTADPRTLPTPTAFALGSIAAEEVVRAYLQDHGDYPRALVFDLWGSASLRNGGEDMGQGLALMGCRPQWDPATGRVIGVEVLPPAVLGRPRIDVTWRISGLFRDLFPTQIALMDAAVAAVAAREGEGDDNPLARAAAAEGGVLARVFGSAPGTYGAGLEDKLADGAWETRADLGHAYLNATSHSFGGAEGTARVAPGAFAGRVASADLLVHVGDDPGRDLLEGSADVAFIGGFSAALAALGSKADLVMLDTTDPQRPRARSLASALARIVRARALNPVFIAGQMRHGPRGASELVETVDRLIGFAETTDAVPGALIEAVHDAYLGDAQVRAFLARENPAALHAMAARFADARARGLWHPRRNAVDEDLAALVDLNGVPA